MIELLIGERHFNDRTAYFEQLVRDDWDKRATPQMQAELTAFLAQEEKALALNDRPKGKQDAVETRAEAPSPANYRTPGARGKFRKPRKFPKG